MRVISGKYKGRKLNYEILGTRPTMDRVKESLFAIIQDYIKESVVLDLFAGSGSLGIEALSNGASKCYFVDYNIKAINVIKENTKGINNCVIINEDYIRFLNKIDVKFDIVFLDPPYHENMIEKAIDLLLSNNLLNDNALIICEYEKEFNCTLAVFKEKKYGNKIITIYKCS